ncbi:NmrA-like family domain-containing protein 1 [Echria macrotheca]|uniref:NmrA-like family domain-containing protein 1 n=1 Tax=Echria macrotheca TaxID=438768 RepID=A0AAJ0BL36_9PEZI|nr:NmrA-like family domain-containing protein 1 [Echria macrotheca]
MATHNILVVGATGKQGGAVIKALLALPPTNSPPLHILALTRNPSSPSAQSLAAAHKEDGILEIVQGDTANPEPIFTSRPADSPIHAVFLVTVPPPSGKVSEQNQAKPFIDAAVAHGVRHLVFSSVDRGGDERSWTNSTDIGHFAAKHEIELYLRDKASTSGDSFTWTILRPVAFMDNFSPGFFGSMMSAMMYAALSRDKRLQLVSVHDIGVAAAAALTDPTKWAGRAVGLAGDAVTLDEAREKFRKVSGGKAELPQTWTVLARLLMWAVKDVGTMFEWFEKEGYGVDIEALKREIPMQDFETWLRESSQFKF